MSLHLPGLRSTPLSRYLCAIGLLRVVGIQHDRSVRGSWDGTEFTLDGINGAELTRFILDEYQPAPVVSPWNKEGDPNQNSTTAEQLRQIADSVLPQLVAYRTTIASMRSLIDGPTWSTTDKTAKIMKWRSVAPDGALAWIDAAVVLASDKPVFPALLGTGGNDGRFEISRLYQKEVVRLFLDPKADRSREGWLDSFLFDRSGPPLVDSTVGQFDPDASGGINSSAQGAAKSAANPWAILFTIEGAMAFRAGAASRLGFGRTSTGAAPFTVKAMSLSDLDAPGESVRAELWAPVWDRAATWGELSALLGEGRLAWKGRQSRTSLDARRAVADLGTARGITRFERFGFAERNGLAYVAVHAGSVATREVAGIGLLAELDNWVTRVPRGDQAPASIVAATRRVERAQFELADGDGQPSAFQRLLIEVSALERAVGRSAAGRERIQPLGLARLPARDWVALSDDGTGEASIALGLASLRDPGASTASSFTSESDDAQIVPSCLRMALALRSVSHGSDTRQLRWPTDPTVDDPAVSHADGRSVVFEVFRRRLRLAPSITSAPAGALSPFVAAFPQGRTVPLRHLIDLLDGTIDVRRVVTLARAFALLDWSASTGTSPHDTPSGDPLDPGPELTPPWFAALKLCFLPRPQSTPDGERWLFADHRWPSLIAGRRTDEVVRSATNRLRYLGVTPRQLVMPGIDVSPESLAISLLCRLPRSDVHRLRNTIAPLHLTTANRTHQEHS